jgi:xanthine dehydrogenase accessory factor
MKERHQIIRHWRQGYSSILITLVRVQGSSYRQVGARMMLGKDGGYEGSISGGCLEADVLRKASWLIRKGATVESYSTLFDVAGEMPFGLGCGGVVDLLLESVESPECTALLESVETSLAGHKRTVATWLPDGNRSLMRAIFSADGTVVFASEGLAENDLNQARAKFLHDLAVDLPGVFVERLDPPQRLFVFGAGEDTKPLVSMAALQGWRVIVIDGRSHFARADRFPEATVKTAEAISDAIREVTARDAVVLMTHSYEQDKEFLTSLLPIGPNYLGLLGSRQRSSLLIAEAAATLGWSITECCERVSAPIGLDIGGEGREAIALAIVAEIQASCMGKQMMTRRLSAERVQSYLADESSKRYLQSQCRTDSQ